jgi:type I restriction enzyme S subunit
VEIINCKISEILRFLPKSKIKASEGKLKGKYPFFTSSNTQDKFLDYFEVTDESIIIGTGGKANIHYSKGKFSVSTDCFVLQAINPDLINIQYVYYYLRGNMHILENGFRGAGLKHISKEYIQEINIPIPPLRYQLLVIKILNEAESLIEKRKAQIEALDQLTKSVFLEMFGDPFKNPKDWDVKLFEHVMIGSPQNGLYKPSSEYTQEGGTPILRIDSFYDGKITNITQLKRLKCTEEEVATYGLNNNDIVINRVNSIEYLGKCALVENLLENTVFESNMMRIKVNLDIVNPKYLVVLLCSQFIYNQIIKKAKKSVNQASINQKDVSSLHIIIPPIELQNEFERIIRQIDTQKEKLLKGLCELEKLLNSLLQRAFNGELFTGDKVASL